ncbi:unnamed protein product [Plutella xylostella]|uniref:(diamondback moth) hypothetical protein n=1 Tax=Plutella xylostella TaxID=51655 RepID=A0A8S4GHF7_PLUXY|nr:unnamed protein product [Plutella xylostella]
MTTWTPRSVLTSTASPQHTPPAPPRRDAKAMAARLTTALPPCTPALRYM